VERYSGLYAHGTSCTIAVIGPSDRKLRHDVVETQGSALVSYLRSIPGRKHLSLGEGTHSAWLYVILSPHVAEILVSEAAKHSISRIVATAPGLGPNRVARLLPIVVSPDRFRTRSPFWAYCGMAIVTRSSSNWVQTRGGGWPRSSRGCGRTRRSTIPAH